MKIKMCCATLVYFPFNLEDNVVLGHSGAMPTPQPPISPWLSLGSAQPSGEEEGGGTGGVAQGATL